MPKHVLYGEIGDRQDELWESIPFYQLGAIPGDLPEKDHRMFCAIKAKRALMSTYDDDEWPNRIADMLTELRHLCDVLEIDFDDCDRVACNNYIEERHDQDYAIYCEAKRNREEEPLEFHDWLEPEKISEMENG